MLNWSLLVHCLVGEMHSGEIVDTNANNMS